MQGYNGTNGLNGINGSAGVLLPGSVFTSDFHPFIANLITYYLWSNLHIP